MCLERICSSGIEGLDVLPCGPRPSDPAELLSRERFHDLLSWAETLYDQILVDSPPALAATDAAIIGRLTDGVIVVVQPQKNHRRRVLRAVEGLGAMGVNLMGVVVNAVASDEGTNYHGYGADYGYGYGYGYAYGNEDEHSVPFDSKADSIGPLTTDHAAPIRDVANWTGVDAMDEDVPDETDSVGPALAETDPTDPAPPSSESRQPGSRGGDSTVPMRRRAA